MPGASASRSSSHDGTPQRQRSRFGRISASAAARREPSKASPATISGRNEVSPSNWRSLDFAVSSPTASHATVQENHFKTPDTHLSVLARGQAAQPKPDRAQEDGVSGFALDSASKATVKPPERNSRTLVGVRVCAPNAGESNQAHFESCINVDTARKAVELSQSFLNKKLYTFDATFDAAAQTDEIYQALVLPLVEREVLEGRSAFFTVYGQSMTGKTQTLGSSEESVDSGCILSACRDLLAVRKARVYLSCIEMFNEETRDLLVPDAHDRARGKMIDFEMRLQRPQGVSTHAISTVDECISLIRTASKRRVCLRRRSSGVVTVSHLGHMICKFIIRRDVPESDAGSTGHTDMGQTCSSLSFVELAGPERRDLNHSDRKIEDTRQISSALSSLSSAIQKRKQGIRGWLRGESRLCALLQDALAGRACWTVLIAVVPSVDLLHETTTSLLFGQRAMLLGTAPVINDVPPVSITYNELPISMGRLVPSGNCAGLSGSMQERTDTNKARWGSVEREVCKVPREVSTEPRVRRKIAYTPRAHREHPVIQHPVSEFSNYVVRQLSAQQGENMSLANAEPLTSERIEAWSPGTPKWTPHKMQSRLAGDTSQLEQTRESPSRRERHLRFVVEDLVELHEQKMAAQAGLPSVQALTQVNTDPHLSTMRDIFRVLIDSPQGLHVLPHKLQRALDLLAAGDSDICAEESCLSNADIGPDHALFAEVFHEMLVDESHRSEQEDRFGFTHAGDSVQSRHQHSDQETEVERMVMAVLSGEFTETEIGLALHATDELATSSANADGLKSSVDSGHHTTTKDKHKSSVLIWPLVADLHASRMSDALQDSGGRFPELSLTVGDNHPEIVHRLDAYLQRSHQQEAQLHACRQEAVAAAALCEAIAGKAIEISRRANHLSNHVARSREMLLMMGQALCDEQRRSHDKMLQMQTSLREKDDELSQLRLSLFDHANTSSASQKTSPKRLMSRSTPTTFMAQSTHPMSQRGSPSIQQAVGTSPRAPRDVHNGTRQGTKARRRSLDLGPSITGSQEGRLGIAHGNADKLITGTGHMNSRISSPRSNHDLLHDLQSLQSPIPSKLKIIKRLQAAHGCGLSPIQSEPSTHRSEHSAATPSDNEQSVPRFDGSKTQAGTDVESSMIAVESGAVPGGTGSKQSSTETARCSLSNKLPSTAIPSTESYNPFRKEVGTGSKAQGNTANELTATTDSESQLIMPDSAVSSPFDIAQEKPPAGSEGQDADFAAARQAIAMSMHQTLSFWQSCQKLFMLNRSGAQLRKILGTRDQKAFV